MSLATADASGRSPRSSVRSGPPVWVMALSAIGFSMILFLVVRFGGYVEGEEFSPTHFRSRDFSFYEIPILHWQITPITRKSTTPPMALLVSQKRWVRPSTGQPEVWHLISIRRGLDDLRDDDAALLMKQMRYQRGGSPMWQTWTQDHPQAADVLWPTIAQLAQRELYVLMPRIFEWVRGMNFSDLADGKNRSDAEILRVRLRSYLQEQYASLVRDMRAAGRDDLADALETEATGELVPEYGGS